MEIQSEFYQDCAFGEELLESIFAEGKPVDRSKISQQQMQQVKDPFSLRLIAGKGSKSQLRDAHRLSHAYGGTPEDWQKVKSDNFRLKSGANFEVHAYRNTQNGKIYEPKTKLYNPHWMSAQKNSPGAEAEDE